MQLFSLAFYFKYMLNLQFRVCNDDFLSARLYETQSELKPVRAFALVKVSLLYKITSVPAVEQVEQNH